MLEKYQYRWFQEGEWTKPILIYKARTLLSALTLVVYNWQGEPGFRIEKRDGTVVMKGTQKVGSIFLIEDYVKQTSELGSIR